jgi:hypothetical protein
MLLGAALMSLLAQIALAQEWPATRSSDGRFKAVMPSKARYLKQNINTAIGVIQLHRFTVIAGEGRIVYTVLYNDYPQDYVQKTGAKEILLDTQKRSHGPLQEATIKNDKEISLGKHPGREFEVSGTGEGGATVYCTWRHFLVGNRLYQLGVLGTENQDTADNLKKFFESFALLDDEKK